jgi:PKD repeat protein
VGHIQTIGGQYGFPGGSFGAQMSMSARGATGLNALFYGFNEGQVNVDYPVEVTLSRPEADSFRAGDTVTIASSWAPRPGTEITTAPPDRGSIGIEAFLGLHADIDAEICVYDCVDVSPVDIHYDTESSRLLTADSLIAFDNRSSPGCQAQIEPVCAFARLPNIQTQSNSAGRTVTASGEDTFMDVVADIDAHYTLARGLPPMGFQSPDLGLPGPLGDVELAYETLDVESRLRISQEQDFEFAPKIETVLQFTGPVNFTVNDGGDGYCALAATVCSGTASVVIMRADHSVSLAAPDAVLDVTPKFRMEPDYANFRNDTVTNFSNDFSTTVAEATLRTPRVLVIPSVVLVPEICVTISLPFGKSKEKCTPEVRSPEVYADSVSIGPLGPLFEHTINIFDRDEETIFTKNEEWFVENAGNWTLGGFNEVTVGSFEINPEFQCDPGIVGPTSGFEGQLLSFSGSPSSDRDPSEILTYVWDFGDGTGAVGINVDHSYADNGTYLVTVVIDDGHELPCSASLTVVITNEPPEVRAGTNKTADEGSPVGLGLDLFGRNLVLNGQAEAGTSAWTGIFGGFSTVPYLSSAEPTVADTGLIGANLITNGGAEFPIGTGTSGWSASQSDIAHPYGSASSQTLAALGLLNNNLIVNPGAEFTDSSPDGLTAWSGSGKHRNYLPCPSASVCPRDLGAGWSDTGEWFQVVGKTINWFDAKLEAEARTHAGLTGHLATFHSDDEARFVRVEAGGAHSRWIGGFQPDNCCEHHGGWAWVTGEPFTYTNWAAHEPNGGSHEDHLQFWNSNTGQWNDRNGDHNNGDGYVVQYGVNTSLPLPPGHGNRQFFGGYNQSSNSLSQSINVSDAHSIIDEGQVSFDFSGWLGGGGRENDRAWVVMQYRNAGGSVLATHQLGPVYRHTRGYKTGMIQQATSGSVPIGTRSVDVQIFTLRETEYGHDHNNSAQVDNLSLNFTASGVNPSGVTTYGFPVQTPGPDTEGSQFFYFGSGSSFSASQSKDISGARSLIDEGQVNYDLSGYLGGFDGQDDRASLTARFKNSGGGTISTVQIGNVTSGDRSGVTRLLSRSASGVVPAGARTIDIELVALRSTGSRNDGYADNLSLVLTAPGVNLAGVPVGGFPRLNSPGPAFDRGLAVFAGDPVSSGGSSSSGASQFIDVSEGADLIDSNDATFSLKGYLGGFDGQNDSGRVVAIFRDGPGGSQLGSVTIGPVTASERGGVTGSALRSLDGGVPVGTRQIEIALRLDRTQGTRNNGTVDNLTFVLDAPSGAVFTDPGIGDTHTALIEWGDGSSEVGLVTQGQGLGSVLATHIYKDNGFYTVTVTITDDDGEARDDSFTITVNNVSPRVTAVSRTFVVDETSPAGLLATFSDPGTDCPTCIPPSTEDFTATIDWGDGKPVDGPFVVAGGQVTGTHEYDEFGTHSVGPTFPTTRPVRITVFDDDGGSTVVEAVATITDRKIPSVTIAGTENIDEGGTASFTGSYLPVPNPFAAGPDPTLTYDFSWTFGDLSPAFTGSLSASHQYAEDGLYPVTLTVSARNIFTGALVTAKDATLLVTVANLAPVVEAGGNQSSNEGALVLLSSASFTDAGVLDSHKATIDWGDGTNPDSGVINSGSVSGAHAYADNGTYTVTVTVCDDELDCGSDTLQVSVGNVTPSVNAGGAQNVAEGQLVTLAPATFSDPGFDCPLCDPATAEDFTAAIDWGDGTTEPAGDITLIETPGAELVPTAGTVQASHHYADNGSYTVTVSVCDDDGACGNSTLTVNVGNVAPVVEAGPNQSNSEGVFLTLAPATFSDPGFDHAPGGTNETFTASVNWGDGTSEPAGAIALFETPGAEGQPTTGSVQAAHAFADDGSYVVTVQVCDDDGLCGSDTLTVTIANVAPTIDAGDSQTADEGDTVSLDPATYTDLGFDNSSAPTSETHTATISWGDGTVDSGTVSGVPGSEGVRTTGTIDGSHVYADDGLYTVEVEVCDDNGGCSSGLLFVTVNSVTPTVEAGTNQASAEGDFISLDPATFSDAGFDCPTCAPPTSEDFEATIDWGDGTTEPAGDITLVETTGQPTTGSVQGAHAYADNGVYTVTVQVCDDDGYCGSDTLTVTVGNVAPTILTIGDDQETFEGIFINLAPVTFEDPGFDNLAAPTGESFTASINWGDNTSEPPGDMIFSVAQGSEGTITTGTMNASHSYPDDGTFTVTIEVCDDDGGCDSGSFDVTVLNIPPTVEAGEDQTVEEGFLLTLDPATFEDVGFDNPLTGSVEDFTATIDWGDGTTEPTNDITLIENPGDENNLTTGTVQAAHAYGDDGTYVVTVCVDDDDGGHTCDTLTVTVINVAPSANAGPDVTIDESGTVTLAPATYSDPGFDHTPAATVEDFTSTIDWGEGTVDIGALTETPGGEEILTVGTVSGSHVYGDDGPYTITVCVTDDQNATTCDTLVATVNNVAPVLDDSVFLADGTTFTSGDDAFMGRKGVEQTHSAAASDVGSDDLRYDWAFIPTPDQFGGALPPNPQTETTTTFNDGSAPGPLPFTDPPRDTEVGAHPHGIFPFASGDTASVTFTGPGVYSVEVTVVDDNGGTDFVSLPKIVTDDCDCTENLSFWKKEFKERKPKDAKKVEKGKLIAEDTLEAYLDIIRFTSSHFNEVVPLGNTSEANNVFDPPKQGSGSGSGSGSKTKEATNESATGKKKKKKGGDSGSGSGDSDTGTGTAKKIAKKREEALQQTLAAWLNFAKGAVDWEENIIVDPGTGSKSGSGSGTGTRPPRPPVILPFNEVIAQVEAILNNTDATFDDLKQARKLAESINKHDKDNPACDTGSGSGSGSRSGTASKSSNGGDDSGSGAGSKSRGKKGK